MTDRLLSPLLSAGVQGTWSSSSEAVLQVDPRSGAAVARDFGTATVYYEIPGALKTYSEVRFAVGAARTSAEKASEKVLLVLGCFISSLTVLIISSFVIMP